MIILAVDPGFQCAGFCILKKDNNRILILEHGFLTMKSKKPLFERTGQFYAFFEEKIINWNVTDLALETPFFYKNAQNFLKLGYLRGILYLLVSKNNLKIHEFSPREIKLSLTGFGAADKQQVSRIILQLFPNLQTPKKFDVTDAIAIGICAIWHKPKL